MDSVCPLLGLLGDRRTAVDGVDGAHRCHAEDPPTSLEHRVQAQLCLTSSHVRCERYVSHLARAGRARPAAVFGDGLVSTRMLVAPEPVWRGIAGRARSAPRGPLIAGAVAVAAVSVGGAAVTAAALDGRLDLGISPPSDAPAPVPSATLAVTVAVGPSATLEPSPMPSASAATPSTPLASSRASVAPAPTPAPTVAPQPPPPAPEPPPPQQTYAVQQGDTLALIAERFGTTVQALQAANGIDDADEIVIGQVLEIP